MGSELADIDEITSGIPLPGTLAEARYLDRYSWAGGLCVGQRVLEIGCGSGRGCGVLLEEGAREVVGVDLAQAVIEAAASTMPQAIRLLHFRPPQLPAEDDGFQSIVWFEPLPFLRHLEPLLDEVVRVLAPDGKVILAWPNREITLPGGHGDRLVFAPRHMLREVRERFSRVQLFRQNDWAASVILDDGSLAAAGIEPLRDVLVSKPRKLGPGTEAWTLAVAGHTNQGVDPGARLTLVCRTDGADWAGRFEQQQAVIRGHLERIAELEHVREERDELRRQLRLHEQTLNTNLNRRVQELEKQLTLVMGSISWRLTAPLRYVTAPARMAAAVVRRLSQHARR